MLRSFSGTSGGSVVNPAPTRNGPPTRCSSPNYWSSPHHPPSFPCDSVKCFTWVQVESTSFSWEVRFLWLSFLMKPGWSLMSTTLFYMELGREGHFKEQEHKPTGCLYLSKFPPPSPPPPKKGLIFKSIGKKDCYLNSHTHNCRFIYQSGLF